MVLLSCGVGVAGAAELCAMVQWDAAGEFILRGVCCSFIGTQGQGSLGSNSELTGLQQAQQAQQLGGQTGSPCPAGWLAAAARPV